MKNNCIVSIHKFGAILAAGLLSFGPAFAGTTIVGPFPEINGGFEGDTVTTLSSIGPGIVTTNWTIQNGSGTGPTLSTTGGRSGPYFITNYSATASRRFQSPTAATGAIAASTAYVIQMYYRTAGAVNATSFAPGVSSSGTGNPSYITATTLPATSGAWSKFTATVTTVAATPTNGIAVIRFSAADAVPIDVDDFCIYAGSTPDTTAPDPSTGPSVGASVPGALDLSWTAPGTGVDGGGYVVVRGTSDPTTAPLVNGIYAVGNSVAAGQTVAYVGTATSFTDTGLNANTTYYYRIYTVDKAFNYSSGVTANGTTLNPVAPIISGISPSSITTNAAGGAAFTVTLSQGSNPLTYRWFKETATTTNLISGATNATLTLTNVLMADTANYQVIVTNAAGSDTSAVVSLTVIDPVLVQSPVSQTNLLNSSTYFTVSVLGTQPFTYQWYRGNPDPGINSLVTDGARVAGSQSNVLSITNLIYGDADTYFVIATNIYGAVTSSVASLTVTNAGVLAYWDFNQSGLNGTNPAPEYGPIGASTSLANTTNAFLFATTGNNDPITSVLGATNYAWGSASYPFNGNVANNKTVGLGFKASTVGLRNLTVSYDSRASATGSKYERLQYTTNGTDYVDFPGSTDLNPASLSTVTWHSQAFSLVGFPGVRDNPNFGIRVVAEFESTAKYGMTNDDLFIGYSSTYATNGTLSKDIVTLSAESITNASTPPTITALLDRTNVYDSPFTVNFTVGDAETAAANLTVTAKSFNQSVVADGNIAPGGSGTSRNIQITPSAIGKAPILVTVTDTDGDSVAAWFMLTTIPSDFPPVISSLAYTNTLINTTITIPFTISDDHASASTLYASLSATSGNQTLVPNANISFGGSGNNPTIIINPAAGQVGIAPITVSVNDGVNPATTASFNLMVRTNTSVVFNDSFDYDASGNVTSVSLGLWQAHSGANNGPIQVGSGTITVNGNNVEDINAPLLGAPYTTNSSAVLYSSFKVNFSALPTLSGTYFAHFKDDGTFGFMGRVYASILNAAAGTYRLGIGNGTGVTNSTAQFPMDLSLGTSYTVVTKLDISNAVATIWINPTSISDTHMTDSTVLDPTNHFSIYTYAFRQSTGEGTMTVDDLKVGTTFTAVTGLAAGPAPSPTIQSITIQGGNIVINGTNNNTSGNQTYYILSSTNLTLPLAQWTSIATNTFNGSGNFSATNAMGANAQQFYLLQVP